MDNYMPKSSQNRTDVDIVTGRLFARMQLEDMNTHIGRLCLQPLRRPLNLQFVGVVLLAQGLASSAQEATLALHVVRKT